MSEGTDVLERFGLTAYAHRPVAELPEGGRKILDVALSFALKPQLLLMDEPTSGVSIEEKFPVMDTLVGVLQESDMTILSNTTATLCSGTVSASWCSITVRCWRTAPPTVSWQIPPCVKPCWVRVVMLSVAGMRVIIKGFIICGGSHSIFQPESALPW